MIWKAILAGYWLLVAGYWLLATGSAFVARCIPSSPLPIFPSPPHPTPRTSQTVKIITVFFNYLKLCI